MSFFSLVRRVEGAMQSTDYVREPPPQAHTSAPTTMHGSGGQFDENDNHPTARERPDQMIHFRASDGDASERPNPIMLDRSVVDGNFNYMRKVFLNEPAAKLWRKKIGTNLARDMNYDLSKEWYLADWVSFLSALPDKLHLKKFEAPRL